MEDATKLQHSPGDTFSMSCHLTCAKYPRSLVGPTEKRHHVHAPVGTVKNGAK